MGTSLIFLVFIAALIILLDIQVYVDEPEKWMPKSVKTEKTIAYKFTIFWGIILICLGISAIYISDKYRKHYAFECNIFFVDHGNKTYHIDNKCDGISNKEDLEKMFGYEISNSYKFCEACEEYLEYAEIEYESNRYFRP